ncbi:sugar transporter ERD6-like 7 isoform X2 [Punica granatum]|uniref:Sugar transporter ERD6-like 7 isoform X2 n=1 Tax=Punica granatum TaxID=22663 RepID=A0A6P8C0X1_PUNGR|nr:sugar transporter ERD6-like 7 isoform X2 [Punica granatum]
MLTMACGVSIMFIIGPVLYWRLLALIGMAPCLLQLLGLFFVPESPRWLANMGRRKEAEGALQRLWGRNADISKEAAEIEVTHFVKIDLSTDEHVYIYIYFFFLVRPILQAFKSCHRTDSSTYFSKNMHVHLLCISHSWIYNSCHNSADSNHPGYILNGQIRKTTPTTGQKQASNHVFASQSHSWQVGTQADKFHLCRWQSLDHALAISSQDSHSCCRIFTGGAMLFPLWRSLAYGGSYSLGLGGIPWVMMSEIFPVNLMGSASSIVNLVSWGGSWVVAYTFNGFFLWSSAGVFFFYASVCLFGTIFVVKMVPETKGQTMEDVQASMNQ